MRSTLPDSDLAVLPDIEIPPSIPPSPGEIARRQAHFVKVMALREEIGPIGITTDELVHAARQEMGDVDADDW